MQKNKVSLEVKQQLVRNVEKTNTKAFVQREFVVDPLIHLTSDDGKNTEVNVASNMIKQIVTKASKGPKHISENVEAMVDQKTSKKLNFAFDEVFYQGLIPLNEVKPTASSVSFKHIARPPRKLDPVPEPVNNPHFPKHEFVFLHYDVKGKEFGLYGNKNHNFGHPEYVKTFKDPNDYIEKGTKVAKYPMLNTVAFDEDLSGLRKFRQLQVSLGMKRPKLQSHFDGYGLHRKSQAWKL